MSAEVRLHVVGELSAFSRIMWAYDDDGRAWRGTRRAGDEHALTCEVPVQRLDWRRVAPSKAPKGLADYPSQGTISVEVAR